MISDGNITTKLYNVNRCDGNLFAVSLSASFNERIEGPKFDVLTTGITISLQNAHNLANKAKHAFLALRLLL